MQYYKTWNVSNVEGGRYMTNVTGRIGQIKQPRGGYVKPSMFDTVQLVDDHILNDVENIHGVILGMAVDYLVRYLIGKDVSAAFRISLKGAERAEKYGEKGSIVVAQRLMQRITGLNDESIVSACKLVSFDVWLRNPMGALTSKGVEDINPDAATIQNIEVLVKRSMNFFEKYGPVVRDGFTFEPKDASITGRYQRNEERIGNYGGYTAVVSSGDGDYLTEDTMWDLKVSKTKPTSKNTLQILMYWIMGKHSGRAEFEKIIHIGIFNPRLNVVYLLDINKIPKETIKIVEKEVICY